MNSMTVFITIISLKSVLADQVCPVGCSCKYKVSTDLFLIECTDGDYKLYISVKCKSNVFVRCRKAANVTALMPKLDESVIFPPITLRLRPQSHKIEHCIVPTKFSAFTDKVEFVVEYSMAMSMVKTLDGFFDKPSNLTKFDISRNKLRILEADVFMNLELLEKVDLSYNLLTNLSASVFQHNRLLKHVKINNNRILNLLDGFLANKPLLETVSFIDNEIMTIADSCFANTSNLKFLLLDGNKMNVSIGREKKNLKLDFTLNNRNFL